MAITGISSIDNKQIIAAGALSAISANQALITSGGNSLQGLYDTVSTNSGSWTGGGGGGSVTSPLGTISVVGSNIEATNSAVGTIVSPSASALLGNDVEIVGTWNLYPSVFNFTLPVSGGTLYAIRTTWYGTETFNFSGKDLNGNITTGTMTVGGTPGTYTADLNEIVSDLSAQGTQGDISFEEFYATSPSASNSGVYELAWKKDVPTGNVFTGYNTYTAGSKSYSAVIDTDYKLTAGNATYSLIGAYTNTNNKFYKVSDSNTLFDYSSHYEMGNKAYKPDIVGTINADRTEINPGDIYVEFQFREWPVTAKIDKIYLTFDATKSGTVNASGWELLSSNNNHYEFVKYHTLGETNPGLINEYFTFDYNSWGTITNATASADIYSALNLKELAFKDDLTGGSVPAEVMYAASAVSANSAKWNETTDTLSANSGAWGGSNNTFYIYPGTTTDKEISENSAKDMKLYNSANNTYLDYAGKTTYSTNAILDFKNLSGVGSNTNTVEYIRIRVYPTATSACSIYTTGSVSLLASNSTISTASTAYYDSDGNYLATTRNELTALSSFIQNNSGSWTGGGSGSGSTSNLIYRQFGNGYGGSGVYLSGNGDVVFSVYAPNGISTITINYPDTFSQDTAYFNPDYNQNNIYTSLYTVTGNANPDLNVQDVSNWQISAGDMIITNQNNAGFEVGSGSFIVNSTAYLTTGNIERYNPHQGYHQQMTSWYDTLSDYQMTGATGQYGYFINMNGDSYSNDYNWEVTVQQSNGGSTINSADVFPPTTSLSPGMTYTLKWNDTYGLYWNMDN